MTFNTRKNLPAQQLITIGVFELDKCRHTTSQSVTDGAINASASVTDSFTGTIAITGGTATSFSNSNPYILWDTEIIKVTVNSDIEVDITGRGEFGTVAASHSAGSAKLMHSGEADGSCYSFPDNCTSPDTYDENIKHNFMFPSTQLDLDQVFFNNYKSWSHTPAVVDPGQSIGKRAGGSITFIDSVDNDVYVPYPERRTSDGMLFSKWLARHPNFGGRPFKVLTGFNPLDFNLDNFITREYIIDSVSLNNGIFNVKFLDPLILSEDKKAKAPLSSSGVLSVLIDDSSTTITHTGAPALDYGSVSSTVFVRVGGEVIECTVLSDFVLTIVSRASGGTEQKDHRVNSTVQSCLVFENVNVVEIIQTIMTDFTTIPTRFFDDYSQVIAATSTITLSANINKPTSVNALINELIKNGDLVMFYSETEQLIKIKQVSDSLAGAININEVDHIEKDSISTNENVKNQFTRYSVAWATNNVTKTKDEEYFSIIYQSINLNQELPVNKGDTNEKKIFFNRWLTDSNNDILIGASIAQREIDRSDAIPEIFKFNLDIESVFETQGSRLEEGTIFNLSTSKRVYVDGSPKAENHQVLSMKDLGNMRYEITSRLFQDPINGVNIDFTISTNKENYVLSTEFAPVAGNYTIMIDAGVIIGSTSISGFAFTTGVQADGVTFNFIIRGSILGKGADGADGGVLLMPLVADSSGSFSQVGSVGRVGGNAFEATVNCTINIGSGAFWAGGGSGAGEISTGTNNVDPLLGNAGNGGSGGQGYGISFGGAPGTTSLSPGILIDTGQAGASGNVGSRGILGTNEGGSWGESGTDESGVSGGLPGFAIVSNGNNVLVTSGDNPINIKGRRS